MNSTLLLWKQIPSGTSKTGKIHNYYVCNGRKRKTCEKKNVQKAFIEDLVVSKCRELLTDENISLITREVLAIYEAETDSTMLKHLQKSLGEVESAISNLLKALEQGQAADVISGRLQERAVEKKALEAQIAVERLNGEIDVSEADVRSFLLGLRRGDINDIKYRRMLVTVFVDAIYLYDDKVTIILNTGERAITLTEELIDAIEEKNASFAQSSFMESSAPP